MGEYIISNLDEIKTGLRNKYNLIRKYIKEQQGLNLNLNMRNILSRIDSIKYKNTKSNLQSKLENLLGIKYDKLYGYVALNPLNLKNIPCNLIKMDSDSYIDKIKALVNVSIN